MTLSSQAQKAIATQHDPIAVLQAAVGLTRKSLDDCAVFAAVPEPGGPRITITSGTADPRFSQIKLLTGAGLGGYVLEHRCPVIVDDYPNDPRISRDFVHIVSTGEGLHGIVCVPILVQGRPEGLLYAGRRSVGSIGDRTADQLQDAAKFAAIGIQQAQDRRNALELERLRDRERLAAVLHDSVAQMLFGISIAAEESLKLDDSFALQEAMRSIGLTAANARQELRDTLHRLADSDATLALEARLEAETRLFTTQTGCNARVMRSGIPRRLSDLAEELVVDTTVEGLRNAVRHAQARFVLVYFEFIAEGVQLAIQSELTEPTPGGPTVPSTGIGLAQLRSRAERLGGRLELQSGEDGLKVLRLTIPTAG